MQGKKSSFIWGILKFLVHLIFMCSPLGAVYYALKAHLLALHNQRNKFLQGGIHSLYYLETTDGWRLPVIRYPATSGTTRQFPVLLIHGLSGNRLGFDLPGAPSLARTLSAAGFDVWVLEMRGSNLSFHPKFNDLPEVQQLVFHDFVEKDVSRAVDFVLSFTKAPRLHLLGHSMGGILSTAFVSLSPSHAAKVQSNVLMASSLIYHKSGTEFEKLVPFHALGQVWPKLHQFLIPHRLFTQFIDMVLGPSQELMALFSLQVTTENVDVDVWRSVHRFGFHSIPFSLVLSMYTAAADPRGLCDSAGVPYLDRLQDTVVAGGHFPKTFLLGAVADRQCPVAAVQRTADRLAAIAPGAVQVMHFGVDYGHVADYAHCDLLVGKRCEKEVFPVIVDFFVTNDSCGA
eukprot:EG_transcript_12987